MISLVVVCGIVLALCLWAAWCNENTYKQRHGLIDDWYHDIALYAEYRRVSYNQHMWSLITFRNPYKLYGPLTQEANNA